MILCLCRGVPESAVAGLIARGASTLDDIDGACGAGGDCGACQESLLDMLSRQAAGSDHMAFAGCPR